jgi:hypothetical protein
VRCAVRTPQRGVPTLVPKFRCRCWLCGDSCCPCGRGAVPLAGRFQRMSCRLGTVKVAPVNERRAGGRRGDKNHGQQREPFHPFDANRSALTCQCAHCSTKYDFTPVLSEDSFTAGDSQLRVPRPVEKFPFRQGLWIEDLQTPLGQECSNGSMILLAVVLWRTFCVR